MKCLLLYCLEKQKQTIKVGVTRYISKDFDLFVDPSTRLNEICLNVLNVD